MFATVKAGLVFWFLNIVFVMPQGDIILFTLSYYVFDFIPR